MVYILLALITTAVFVGVTYAGTIGLWMALDKAFGV